MNLIPVILSGGSGTRLWPLSQASRPKQLLSLIGERSLLQQTVQRAQNVVPDSPIMVVCNQEHRFQVAEQLQQIGVSGAKILLEPFGRNTAPAIALAALEALNSDQDVTLLVLPSDHLLKNVNAFEQAVKVAFKEASQGALMTFGINPDNPATGYGYIRASGAGVGEVVQFTEKPDEDTAKKYLAAGNYYWNSGMFLFTAQAYLEGLAEHAPGIHDACLAAHSEMQRDADFAWIPKAEFQVCPSDSIDYAIMEKTSCAKVVPLDAGWSDLGSWQSLWQAAEKDQNGNVLSGEVLLHDSQNCYIHSESGLVGAVGVSDIVVIQSREAVLVVPKGRSEEVKKIVDQLKD